MNERNRDSWRAELRLREQERRDMYDAVSRVFLVLAALSTAALVAWRWM